MVYKRMKTKAVHVGGKTLTAPGEPHIIGPNLIRDEPEYLAGLWAAIKHHGPCYNGYTNRLVTRAIGCPYLYVKSGHIHKTMQDFRRKPCKTFICPACDHDRQIEHYFRSMKTLMWEDNENADYGMLTLVAPSIPRTPSGTKLATAIERCAGAVKRLNALGLLSARKGGPLVSARWRIHVRVSADRKRWSPHVHIVFRGTVDAAMKERIRKNWSGVYEGKTRVKLERGRDIFKLMQYIANELVPIFIDNHTKRFERDREARAIRIAMKELDVLSEYLKAKRQLSPPRCLMGYFTRPA